MDNYLLAGKIINTFGIKGELKVNSNFQYKDRIFKENSNIYVGEKKLQEVIKSVRVHKGYDLLTLDGYVNINEVLKYKGENIYILRSELNLKDNEYLLGDLIGLEVYDLDKLIGVVIDYSDENKDVLLKVKGDKIFYIPLIDYYIKSINVKERKIITNKGSDLII